MKQFSLYFHSYDVTVPRRPQKDLMSSLRSFLFNQNDLYADETKYETMLLIAILNIQGLL